MYPLLLQTLADAAAKAAPPVEQNPLAGILLPVGMMIAIWYFIVIRPQRKQDQEKQAMLSRIKKNDHVVTSGGMKGLVTSVKDDEVTLKVDESNNVRIRFARSAVVQVLSEGEGAPEAADGGAKRP